MQVFNFMKSVIKSVTRPQRGQNRPLFGYVFLFSFPFLRYWALVSFSPFQRRISPCPPSPSPKRYQRPLIVTLFICAHSEAAKQRDKWALPCASTCVRGVRLFMEIGGLRILSPLLSNPFYTDTRSQNSKYSAGRLAPVLWEKREVTCCAE